MRRSLALVMVLVALSSVAMAQAGSANCVLSVRVRTSNERTLETPIQVDVLTSQGVLKSAQSVGDAAVVFQVGSGKTYRLRVMGTGIETVTTTFFVINALEQTHEETVYVRLDTKDQGTEVKPGAASISVSEMSVPKKASVQMTRGLSSYSKGEMEKAAAYFEKAVAEYPHYSRAYDMLGAIAMRSADRVRAKAMFSKSIEADNTYVPAYLDLARMELQDGHYGESEALLSKAIGMSPAMAEALALMAMTEFANKEYDKALADADRMHSLPDHHEYAEVHEMAGKALRSQNRPHAAKEQFELFLMEKPDSPDAASVRQAVAALAAAEGR